jgi:hypothetical protein
MHSNIIRPSTTRSSEMPSPYSFSNQKSLYIFHLPRVGYMSSPPSHPTQFYHLNNIWWSLQVMKLLITKLSLFYCHFIPHRTKYSPQHPVLKHHHPQSMFFTYCDRPSFTPINVKVKLSLCFNWAPCHEGVLGSRGIVPFILWPRH